MNTFLTEFLDEGTLQRLLIHACNNATPYLVDPVTDIVSTMLRSPLEIMLCSTGLMPFKNTPNIVLPFNLMTPVQRKSLNDLISSSLSNTNNSTIKFRSNCILICFNGVKRKLQQLTVESVLMSMCSAIMNSTSFVHIDKKKRVALCNILLQRIGCEIHIKHETFVYMHEQMRKRYDLKDKADKSSASGSSQLQDGLGGPAKALSQQSSLHGNSAPTLRVQQATTKRNTLIASSKKRTFQEMAVED
eukprot:1204244-Rhodomonas_salina.3